MRIFSTLLLIMTVLLSSCDGSMGEPGPPGLPGPPGEDGIDGILGQVVEVVVDFNELNGYQELIEIPGGIEVYDSDIIMAYILVSTENGLDIWEPLPQTLFFGNDILLYGFDYSQFDVRFFLDGTFDPGLLDPVFTEGVIFRFAIIPADFAATFDISQMETLMSALKIDNVERIN